MAASNIPLRVVLAESDNLEQTAQLLESKIQDLPARQDPFKNGQFDLFLAENKEEAEALVFSVMSNEKEYILKQSELGHTALHFHALAPRPEVVEYLLSLSRPISQELLHKVDSCQQTALHLAASVEVAKILVETISPHQRSDFILHVNRAGQTSIHSAVIDNNLDVVKYLMKEINDHADPRLLSKIGQTPLHCADDALAAQCFVESVNPSERAHYICSAMGGTGYTILHLAALNNKTDIIRYLLSSTGVANQLLMQGHRCGGTVLHVVKSETIAEEILHFAKSIGGKSNLELLIAHQDNFGQTAFHRHAFNGQADVLNILLNNLDHLMVKKLVQQTDNSGRNPLHWATNAKCAEVLVEAVDKSHRKAYIVGEDQQQNTTLATSATRGNIEVFEYLMFAVESYIDEDDEDDCDVNTYLTKENLDGEDVYHLAYSSVHSEAFHALFENQSVTGDGKSLIKLSKKGSSSLLHTAAKFLPEAFAQIIMSFPLAQRKQILQKPNPLEADCQTIIKRHQFDLSYYLEKVLGMKINLEDVPLKYVYREHFCSLTGSEDEPPIIAEENISKTMKIAYYAINEFSARAAFLLTAMQESAPTKLELMKTNKRELQGLPKVIICCTTATACIEPTDLILVPPGPDYMMITVHTSINCKFRLFQSSWEEDIDVILSQLVNREEVESITVNSTFGRRCMGGGTVFPTKHLLIAGKESGRALIICNRSRRSGYERELDDARAVLEVQLGLTVDIVYDTTAEEMIENVRTFAQSSSHCSIVALAVMSHGDTSGNVLGDDGRSVCKVQSLVDSLSRPLPANTVKLVLLSFCRGKISQLNRTKHSWECSQLVRMQPSPEFGVNSEEVSDTLLLKEWKYNPLPGLKLPSNCFVCYSTLPDSKSSRGLMFKVMREHLSALYKCQSGDHSCKEATGLAPAMSEAVEGATAEVPKHAPNVQLLDFLTDVSGIVREQSRFTQYLNFCYILNRKSKSIWLEILKF